MNYDDIVALLPTVRQKWTILFLGIAGIGFVAWMVSKRRMRAEHALLWFIGFSGGVVLVWADPILARVSYVLGIDTPASALLLAAVFFLYCLSVWFTSVASRTKQRIEELTIHVSLLQSELDQLRTDNQTTNNALPSKNDPSRP